MLATAAFFFAACVGPFLLFTHFIETFNWGKCSVRWGFPCFLPLNYDEDGNDMTAALKHHLWTFMVYVKGFLLDNSRGTTFPTTKVAEACEPNLLTMGLSRNMDCVWAPIPYWSKDEWTVISTIAAEWVIETSVSFQFRIFGHNFDMSSPKHSLVRFGQSSNTPPTENPWPAHDVEKYQRSDPNLRVENSIQSTVSSSHALFPRFPMVPRVLRISRCVWQYRTRVLL